MEPDGNKTFGTARKLIKLCFFVYQNLKTLGTKIGRNNFLKTNAT